MDKKEIVSYTDIWHYEFDLPPTGRQWAIIWPEYSSKPFIAQYDPKLENWITDCSKIFENVPWRPLSAPPSNKNIYVTNKTHALYCTIKRDECQKL